MPELFLPAKRILELIRTHSPHPKTSISEVFLDPLLWGVPREASDLPEQGFGGINRLLKKHRRRRSLVPHHGQSLTLSAVTADHHAPNK